MWKNNNYFILVLIIILFSCTAKFQQSYRIPLNRISDIEKFEGSLVLLSNDIDPINPTLRRIYCFNLKDRELKIIKSSNFDGYYTRIIKISDTSFTCLVSYDIETDFCNSIYSINGREKSYNNFSLKKIREENIVYKKNILYHKNLLKCNGCNIWKAYKFEKYSIILLNNWKNSQKYYVIKFENNSNKVDILYKSDKNMSMCFDDRILYIIKDNELILHKINE